MADIKHIGRIKATGRKVLVAYRTLPGDVYSALVVPTENLNSAEHDAMMSLVEGNAAQNAYEFAEVLARAKFPDGNTMLPALHLQNKLVKIPTDQIEMTPNTQAVISLAELNMIIAEQLNMALDDLPLRETKTSTTEVEDIVQVREVKTTADPLDVAVVKNDQPLTDEDLARQLRSDADRLYKEAARLRAQAEELAPSKKKVKEPVT